MGRFYTLITGEKVRRPGSDLVGRMYRALAEAREKAAGKPEVLARIDDLIQYTRYAELHHRQSLSGDPEQRKQMITYIYRIRKTMMIHAYGLWARLVGQKAAGDPAFALKSEAPVTEAEILTFLKDGIANNQPVEMGFTPVAFSQDYVPAATLMLAEGPAGSFPSNPQDRHTYYIWVDKAPTTVVMNVTVKKVWNLRPHKITLHSPQEVSLNAVAESGIVKPDGTTYTVALKTPYDGLHRVEVTDGGDYTRMDFPEGMPVMVPSGMDTPSCQTFFRGGWTLSFYVPKGTKVVGGWAARVAAWAPRISGTLRDADGNVAVDFGKLEEGWFNAPVPPGQDGRLWTFRESQGMRQLMTVPPCLALSGKELMLPREVVETDGPKP
jgi:hypothetical protein